MNKIIAFLLAGSAFLATPALAACQFDGQNNVSVGGLMGDASAVGSASISALTVEFWKQASIADATAAGCTKADVEKKIVEINPSGMIPYSGLFAYPLVKPLAAAPAQPAPAASAAPVAQASAAPAAAPKPVTSQVIYQKVELSPAEKAEMAALNKRSTELQSQINSINAKPAPTEADLTALTALQTAKSEIDLKLTAFDDKLNAISGRVNNQAIEMSGMWNWIYGIIGVMVLGFVYFRRRTSNTNRRVKSLEKHTEDRAKTVAIIPEDLAEQLQTLAIGELMTFSIPVNGALHDLTFTRSDAGMVGNKTGKLMVETDDIDRQTYPMKVDRHLVGKLYKAIDAGRFPKQIATAPASLRAAA